MTGVAAATPPRAPSRGRPYRYTYPSAASGVLDVAGSIDGVSRPLPMPARGTVPPSQTGVCRWAGAALQPGPVCICGGGPKRHYAAGIQQGGPAYLGAGRAGQNMRKCRAERRRSCAGQVVHRPGPASPIGGAAGQSPGGKRLAARRRGWRRSSTRRATPEPECR